MTSTTRVQDSAARVRNLIARAAKGAQQLENVARIGFREV
jgi:hypothetical protein